MIFRSELKLVLQKLEIMNMIIGMNFLLTKDYKLIRALIKTRLKLNTVFHQVNHATEAALFKNFLTQKSIKIILNLLITSTA